MYVPCGVLFRWLFCLVLHVVVFNNDVGCWLCELFVDFGWLFTLFDCVVGWVGWFG